MTISLDEKPEWEILGEHTRARPNGKKMQYLNVRCHCGVESAVIKSSVLSGKSTECRGCANKRVGMKRRASSHIGLLTRQYFRTIKRSAKQRGLVFEVSQQQLWNLFVWQKGKCALTGNDINLSTKTKECKRGKAQGYMTATDYTAFNASLDRIDSSMGYVIENVQWVRRDFNFMKQALTQEEFVKNCRDVVAFFDNQEKQ